MNSVSHDPSGLEEVKQNRLNNKARVLGKGRQSLRIDPNQASQALAHVSTERIMRNNSVSSVKLQNQRDASDDLLIENTNYNDLYDNIEVENHIMERRRSSVGSVGSAKSILSLNSKDIE
jgi:hypothetical protein